MTPLKTFAIFALTVTALAMPSLAKADDGRFDRNGSVERHWDRNDRNDNRRDNHSDRGWQRNYSENQRYWNGRTYDNRYAYSTGYERNYHYVQPQTVIVVRPTPYDRPFATQSRTIIYGDGNLTPLPGGGSYYYYNR